MARVELSGTRIWRRGRSSESGTGPSGAASLSFLPDLVQILGELGGAASVIWALGGVGGPQPRHTQATEDEETAG